MEQEKENNHRVVEMRNEVNQKLSLIEDIWNYYILEYGVCSRHIKFTDEVQTNYLGAIIGYFADTFDIIYSDHNSLSYTQSFRNNISLLQSIYVHQDFIEELLSIFKCGITKGDLKLDENYSVNREIRNELIGHPIRKPNGELISSCLFSYERDPDSITYLRYHKENDFKFEKMSHNISEILSRHTAFLNKYFDKILAQLKINLDNFVGWLNKIEAQIDSLTFSKLINFLERNYESIFKYDYLYDKQTLLFIYERKDEHYRYQNLINTFYKDLKISISETKRGIHDKFSPQEVDENWSLQEPLMIFKEDGEIELNIDSRTTSETKKSFHYELGKLATNRDLFTMCKNILVDEFSENELIVDELNHMESNLYNDLEYYCSYRVIRNEIGED